MYAHRACIKRKYTFAFGSLFQTNERIDDGTQTHKCEATAPSVSSMPRSIPNHIRSHRKRWRLSQKELAILTGFKSREFISQIERFLIQPSVRFMIVCEVIFDIPVKKLFPGLFDDLAEDVLNECEILLDRIKSDNGSDATEKRKLMLKLLQRAEP